MTERKRSAAWLYFSADNENTASCTVCLQAVKYNGNTTNLYKHMKKHAAENEELQKRRKEERHPRFSNPHRPRPSTQIQTSLAEAAENIQITMDDLSQLKIGFIGAGNMAFGIAQGIIKSGDVPASNVIVSAPSQNNWPRFQALGAAVTHSNEEVVHLSRLIFLAVKPHLVYTVLSSISEQITPQHIIVSMAAGITLAVLEEMLPVGSCVMRMMPNLPCMLQEGAVLLACGGGANQEVGSFLKSLLSPCGLVEVGPEAWIDAHTGLSGSGVAFVYVFAEALADGAVKMGMPSALAQRIAAQTILGAGRLLRDGEKHPAQLRAEVCTPGGTTIYGLHALEKGGLRAATMAAVEAATERAKELGRK